MSNYSTFGRIIKFDSKVVGDGKTVLSVTINAPTGEKKKEGEQYAPSNILKVTIWDKFAQALLQTMEVGMHVYVTGALGVSYNYINEAGEPKSILQIPKPDQFKMVKLEKREGEEGAAPAATAKATAPKESSTKLPVTEEDDLMPF